MIDKMWWQWQNAHPANFYSFTGGSVPTFGIAAPVTYKTYSEFPNGLPPMLNVRSCHPTQFNSVLTSLQYSSARYCLVMGFSKIAPSTTF